MTTLHAFRSDSLGGGFDPWTIPKDLPCDECGVDYGVHGSFGTFSAAGLDEVECDDTYCLMHSTEAPHTLADHGHPFRSPFPAAARTRCEDCGVYFADHGQP